MEERDEGKAVLTIHRVIAAEAHGSVARALFPGITDATISRIWFDIHKSRERLRLRGPVPTAIMTLLDTHQRRSAAAAILQTFVQRRGDGLHDADAMLEAYCKVQERFPRDRAFWRFDDVWYLCHCFCYRGVHHTSCCGAKYPRWLQSLETTKGCPVCKFSTDA